MVEVVPDLRPPVTWTNTCGLAVEIRVCKKGIVLKGSFGAGKVEAASTVAHNEESFHKKMGKASEIQIDGTAKKRPEYHQ